MDQRDRQNIAVGLVIVLLIGLTYWVMTEMRRNALLEDCLRQRRRDCEEILRR